MVKTKIRAGTNSNDEHARADEGVIDRVRRGAPEIAGNFENLRQTHFTAFPKIDAFWFEIVSNRGASNVNASFHLKTKGISLARFSENPLFTNVNNGIICFGLIYTNCFK